MKEHMQKLHTQIKCDQFDYCSVDQTQLNNHNEVNHKQEAQENKCDSWDFEAGSKDILSEHMASKHDSNQDTVDNSYIENILAENVMLKKELANMKDDFERLNDIFETTRNSSKDYNKNNDIEINKVRDENRILKTENEFLKEKNDTLYKLGKIALETY